MLIYRLGSTEYPVWDGAGAAVLGGRWNAVGMPAIYAAATLSLAMLERVVWRTKIGTTLLVEVRIPPDLPIEDAFVNPPVGWNVEDGAPAQAHGGAWLLSCRTPILRVPSVVVPRECNYVVNPAHPLAGSIVVSDPEPLVWDDRLFATREA